MPDIELHPGVHVALARTKMNETQIAKAMAAGELTSPQKFANSWYFDIRLTGTGSAYREGLKEHVWRDSSLYLNQDFLDRCNGLPVIIDHPPGEMLNSQEYIKRNIGSIVVPYIKGDEVWGIARILDEHAADYMRKHQVSTSPAVVFTNPSVNETIKLKNGEHQLVEGTPGLLDHVAICEEGVWDKGGSPTGVDSTEASKEGQMAELEKIEHKEPTEDDKARDDAAKRFDEKIDHLLKGIKVVADRMDSIEAKLAEDDKHRDDKHRDDAASAAEEAEHAEAAAKLAEEEAEEAEEAATKGDASKHDAARDKVADAMRKFDAASGKLDAARRDKIRGRLDAAHKALDDAVKARDDAHRDDKKGIKRGASRRRDDDGEDGHTMPWEECDRKDGEEDHEYSERMDAMARDHKADVFRKRDDESIAAHCDRVAKGHRADNARRADRARMDSIDKLTGIVTVLADRVEGLARLNEPRAVEDENAFADVQSRADTVFNALGDPKCPKAPAPLAGQNLIGYRIMLLRKLQPHSAVYKDSDLAAVARADSKAFDGMELAIYADAQKAAEQLPLTAGGGKLREVIENLPGGHRSSKFYGSPLNWMSTFMLPGRAATKIKQYDRASRQA